MILMKDIELWNKFCIEKGIDINTPYSSWAFGSAPDKLLDLVLQGIKTATASAYEIYSLDDSEPMPKVNDYSVILNSKDEALCIIKTIKLDVVPFKDVDKMQAFKEGEGDRSLKYWRKVHEEFFNDEYSKYNLKFTKDSLILCEEFEVVYKA